jgi:PBSX family phage terminase large subunit
MKKLRQVSQRDRARAAAILEVRQRKNPTKKAVTGSRVIELRGVALAVQTMNQTEIILTGPAGTGKSIGILHKLHTLAEQYPNARILILRKFRASLTESGMVTFEEKVLPENHPARTGARGQKIERKNRSAYQYPNNSRIVMGGMDEPTRLFSTEYDIIYWQECNEGTIKEWESLLRAIRNNKIPVQQLIGDCNPDVPHHWIMQRKNAKALTLLESKHEDNPALYDAENKKYTPFGQQYIFNVLDKMTGVNRERLRFGRWVATDGVVYEDFSSSLHIVAHFEIPSSWQRYRVIDFGYTNPFVCQWWAADPDGILYLYREIYFTGRIVKHHAEQIKKYSEGETYVATLADHDAEDRATLQADGIHTLAAPKSVRAGIEAVQTRLKILENGKARLYILHDALIEADPKLLEEHKPHSTGMEFLEYAYPKDVTGKPNKEEPVKNHDHGMDAMRYLVMWLEKNSKSTSLADLNAYGSGSRRM